MKRKILDENRMMTEKEIGKSTFNDYSECLTIKEKENVLLKLNTFDDSNKTKRLSFDYWMIYKKTIDIIFDGINDKGKALKFLNDKIIRKQSHIVNENKYFNIFSLLLSIVALFSVYSKNPQMQF